MNYYEKFMNEKIYTSSGYTCSNIPALLKPFFISHGQDGTCSTAFIIHVALKLHHFQLAFQESYNSSLH